MKFSSTPSNWSHRVAWEWQFLKALSLQFNGVGMCFTGMDLRACYWDDNPSHGLVRMIMIIIIHIYICHTWRYIPIHYQTEPVRNQHVYREATYNYHYCQIISLLSKVVHGHAMLKSDVSLTLAVTTRKFSHAHDKFVHIFLSNLLLIYYCY